MQIGDLEQLLQTHEAFRALPGHERAALADKTVLRVFHLGETIIRPGETDRALFIVFAGRARLLEEKPGAEPVTLAVLEKGQTFGEHSLFGGADVYSVRAASDLVVLRLDQHDVSTLATRYPEFGAALERRVHQGTELAFLSRLKIFSSLKLPDLKRLATQLQPIELKAGQELFAEGDLDDTAYIVREGRLRLLKSFEGSARQVGVTRVGDFIGEMGLLCGLPRLLTAVAATRVVVLALSRQVFESVVSDEDREEAMLAATNQLLQLQAFKRDRRDAAQVDRVTLTVRWMKAEDRWFASAYPIVRVDTPVLSGLACLAMTDAFHGKSGVPQNDVDRALAASQPETMDSVAKAAEELGYLTREIRIDATQLHELPLPAIVEWAPGEFAVVFAVNATRVIVGSPAEGLQSLSRASFGEHWNGNALCVTHLPTAVFNTKASAIIRQFLPFATPYKAALLSLAGLSLLSQVFGLVAPLLNKVLIDSVFVTFDRSLLHLLLLGMLIVTAFQMAANSLREYLTAHILRRMSSAVQLRFFDHILSLPVKTIGAWRVGDFLVRLNENEKLLRLVSETGFRTILSVAAIAVNILLLFAMSATMAPIAILFVLAYGVLIVLSSPHLRRASSAVFEARKASESNAIEAISGIQTVKSLALESYSYGKAFHLLDSLQRAEFRLANLAFNIGQIGGLLQQASVVVVLGWGAMLALEGNITTGELIAFNALLGATLGPLAALISVWDDLQEVRLSFERTADVLRLERERNPKDAAVFGVRGDVTLDNITFRYHDESEAVLRNVSLSARAGQKIALVGRSGSGKTTLAGLLLGLYAPSEGRVLVDDIDLTTAHKAALRRQIGYVEQQPHLFSGTIRENIAKPDPTAGLETVVAAATMAGAHGFIQQLPLAYDTQIGERGMTLSGGQKQRIVIARALLNNPNMLVLDEATSALDTESEQAIQRNLDSIMSGKTSFVIAHRLSTVRNADKIVVLDEGRIVEEGTHTQLMSQQGLYYYLATATD